MGEMLWVAGNVSVSKMQTVANYVFLSKSIPIESIGVGVGGLFDTHLSGCVGLERS